MVPKEGFFWFPRSCDLPDGLRMLSLTFVPARDVGLNLGELLNEAERNDRS